MVDMGRGEGGDAKMKAWFVAKGRRRGSRSSKRGQIELWQEQARGRGGARRPEVSSHTWVWMVRQICGEGSQVQVLHRHDSTCSDRESKQLWGCSHTTNLNR